MTKYSVTSVESKPSYHRSLKRAYGNAMNRANVGDSEILILDSHSQRTHAIPGIHNAPAISTVERWLTWGEK